MSQYFHERLYILLRTLALILLRFKNFPRVRKHLQSNYEVSYVSFLRFLIT